MFCWPEGMASKPEATLTLESSAAQEADVVDALPYIDGITADERKQAEELINQEVTLIQPHLRSYPTTVIMRVSMQGTLCAAQEQHQEAL